MEAMRLSPRDVGAYIWCDFILSTSRVRETFLARILAGGSSLTYGATVPLPRRASSSK